MIGVIGCGNMAQAIVKGYYNKNKNIKFLTYTPSYTRAEILANEVHGSAVKSLDDLNKAKVIVIACKPQQLGDLVESIKDSQLDLQNKHIISILAATPIEILQEKLQAKKISRVMPNTPSMIGLGMSLVLHSSEVKETEKNLVKDFFEACGEVAQMNSEEMFDKVTTVSGSGPAYVFLFAKTMAEKLESWGVGKEEAKKIAIQLFVGSSKLMSDQSELELDELISNVTSKGGVTIEAVNSFKNDGILNMTSKALDAAYKRSIEITQELSKK